MASSSATASVEDESPPPKAISQFPVEARVIIQGLVKAPELNGEKGVVRSVLSDAGRHTVYIEGFDKSVGLKPSNIRYEPIALEDLSVKELKMILKHKNEVPADMAGMERSHLQALVSNTMAPSEELPETLANAKVASKAKNGTASISTPSRTQASQAAQQLGNMSPDQLRQQARMMRTMDPATVRRMNPQLANMSDAQLRMAADQMDMMANNPSMMKTAVEQMKNMDPAQLQKMQSNMTGNGAGGAAAAAANPIPSVNQAEQALNMMQNMNPEQLRQQAQMLKTMDPDMIRRTNPQLAHMSDAQIKMAANQFEMMASNPAMMKMAAEQMKNVTPEQMEAMKNGQMPAGGATPDPSALMADMNAAQLRTMLNTAKDSPEMIQQFAAMTGINEKTLKEGIDSFAGMDDGKLDKMLKMMKGAQKLKKIWDQLDGKVGGKLKIILPVMIFFFTLSIIRYFLSGRAPQIESPFDAAVPGEDNYYATDNDLESEF